MEENNIPRLSRGMTAYTGLGIRNTENGDNGYTYPKSLDQVTAHLKEQGIKQVRLGYGLATPDRGRLERAGIIVLPPSYDV